MNVSNFDSIISCEIYRIYGMSLRLNIDKRFSSRYDNDCVI